MSLRTLSLWKIAYCVLYASKRLHVSNILEQIYLRGWTTTGKTPLQTLRAELQRRSTTKGSTEAFFHRCAPATWELTEWGRENPPEHVLSFIQTGITGEFIKTTDALQQNIERISKIILSTPRIAGQLLSFEVILYDPSVHMFMPLSWVMTQEWDWGVVYTLPTEEEALQHFTALVQFEPSTDTDILLQTRFVQWCHEWRLDIEASTTDVTKTLNVQDVVSTNRHRFVVAERLPLEVENTGERQANKTPSVEKPEKIIESSNGTTSKEWQTIPLEKVQRALQNTHPQWVIDTQSLRRLHLAWKSTANQFVLLSGLTGIGKSNLVWNYAGEILQQVGCNLRTNRLMVSVQTNFRDPSPLFGYVNSFVSPPQFVSGLLTEFLLRAHQHPNEPFFLILDETNLAKMEQYLAPWLSTVEVGAPLVFHQYPYAIQQIPSHLPCWPSNIWVAGTMNFEVGSHQPPDKVLDRAYCLEMWEIDISAWCSLNAPTMPPQVVEVLSELYLILRPTYRHFGYRTLQSVVRYVQMGMVLDENAEPSDSVSRVRCLDEVLVAKVFPKVQGSRHVLTTERLQALCQWSEKYELTMCLTTIQRLQQQISNHGAARFWE